MNAFGIRGFSILWKKICTALYTTKIMCTAQTTLSNLYQVLLPQEDTMLELMFFWLTFSLLLQLSGQTTSEVFMYLISWKIKP